MLMRTVPDARAEACAARRSEASRFMLLPEPALEWQRRIAMIRAARCFLYVVTYYVGGDAFGFELLDELIAAQRRGVAVLLGVDALGQQLGNQLIGGEARAGLDERLAALGTAVHFYRPSSTLQRVLGAGQHVKIQLSEAGEALHGSSNLSSRSFDPSKWKEVSFSLWGPVALAAFDTVDALFPAAAAPAHRARLAAATGGAAEMPLEYWWHDPNRPATRFAPLAGVVNPLTQRLVESIDSARATVRATSFYFKPCEPLAAAFERAARRGVAVEVFHSHREALVESAMPWMAAACDYRRWHAAGITVHESVRGEHSKLLLIDDTELAIGSYNFEHAAHDRLAELMVFLHDGAVLAQAAALFDTLRADPDNRVVDAAAYARMPWALRTRTALFTPLRRWF